MTGPTHLICGLLPPQPVASTAALPSTISLLPPDGLLFAPEAELLAVGMRDPSITVTALRRRKEAALVRFSQPHCQLSGAVGPRSGGQGTAPLLLPL